MEDNKSNEVEGRELMEPTRSGRDQISATGTFVRLDRNRIYQRGDPCGPFFAPFSASTAFARLFLCLFCVFSCLFCVFFLRLLVSYCVISRVQNGFPRIGLVCLLFNL